MKNISSRRNLLKDAAILLAIAALLIALPWTQDILNRGDESASREQDMPQLNDKEFSEASDSVVAQKQKAFIAEVFPKISSWEVNALEPHLAAATKSGDWPTEIGSVLSILSERLGQLDRYSEPVLSHIADAPIGEQEIDLATYEFEAHYETGVADINLVIADGGEPTLYSFNINVHNAISSP